MNGGSDWAIASIDLTPSVVLESWHVFEVLLPGRPSRTRHFAGCTGWQRTGRVSNAIREIDPEAHRGLTEHGRVYQLTRRSGFTPEGEHTWRRWCQINRAADVVDVTAEVTALFARPRAQEQVDRRGAFSGLATGLPGAPEISKHLHGMRS